MTTDKEDQLVHDAIVSATGPCVVEFETDETGSLLGIANPKRWSHRPRRLSNPP